MSIKLKALGLSLLAVMATSALVVVNASATSQPTGHFTSDALSGTTALDVVQNPPSGPHMFEFVQPGFTPMVCHGVGLPAVVSGATVSEFTVTPTFKECLTTNKTTGELAVHTNGCTVKFLQPNKESAKTENTTEIVCPAGKRIESTHASCTTSVHPQKIKGLGYTTTNEQAPGSNEGPKHSITLTVAISFSVTRHGGFCALLATNSTSELKGSATIFGTDNVSKKQVNITATGSIN